jgi:hypothetical protein
MGAKKRRKEREPALLKPWARRDAETCKSYQAFVTYRDMGFERSCVAVAKLLRKSRSLIEGWSSRHEWVLRARLFDEHELAINRRENRKERQLMARRHAQEARDFQQRAVEYLRTVDLSKLPPEQFQQLFTFAVQVERDAMALSRDAKSGIG